MANMTTDSGAAPVPDLSLVSRVVGVITAPKATFQSIVARPKWFGMLALTILATSLLVGGFMLTKVGQEAWLDAAIASGGSRISDQQIAGMERMAPYVGYVSMVSIALFVPIFYLICSGLLFAVFNAAMGGNATFKQVFAVVAHTGAIGLLGQLFTVPMNYMRGVMTSATNLAVAFPFVPETSFLGRLLGTIDLFLIWQLVVLAIGLGVLYRRRTQPIAITLFVVYAIIALIIAFVRSSFGGTN
jgi:Yip1-like protein